MNDTPVEPANSGGPEKVDPAAPQAEGTQDIAGIKAENAELRDRLLRNMAEMENLRRRTERERADTAKYAISEFARDAVTIGDNLRRAIEAAQKEPLDSNPPLKTLLEGVEVTERDLFKVLERHGITRFDPKGEKFDPHQHEAMVKIDVPGAAADEVVQVLHAGYKIADRVLRPAAVIVAKGGMPASAAPQPQPQVQPQPEPAKDAPRPAPAAPIFPPMPSHEDAEAARIRMSSMHVNVMREGEGEQPRGPRPGVPRPAFQQPQGRPRERPWAEKRSASSVTRPISEDSPIKRDDVVSTYGKRIDKE